MPTAQEYDANLGQDWSHLTPEEARNARKHWFYTHPTARPRSMDAEGDEAEWTETGELVIHTVPIHPPVLDENGNVVVGHEMADRAVAFLDAHPTTPMAYGLQILALSELAQKFADAVKHYGNANMKRRFAIESLGDAMNNAAASIFLPADEPAPVDEHEGTQA